MENAYKALKYVIIWGAIYFIIKYTSDEEFTNLDIALISTVLTLIICILESMIQLNINMIGYENMDSIKNDHNSQPIVYNTPNNLIMSGNILNEILPTKINQENGIIVENKIEETPLTTNLSKDSIVNINKQELSIVDKNDVLKIQSNYLNEKAFFDVNEFGGTNKQKPSENDNKFNRNDKPLKETNDVLQDNGLKWHEQKIDPRKYAYSDNLDQIAVAGGKTRNDILTNEMVYSDFNRMPPSFNKNDFEYGYSYLPPSDWFPLPAYPPVCVSNCNTNAPQPVYLDSTTMDLKDWHETQKITPPDSINTSFITNELNSKV